MPKKTEGLIELNEKCGHTITLLDDFIDEPSEINEVKAWKCLKEFVPLIGKVSVEYKIKDEYLMLKEFKDTIAILRVQQKNSKRNGFFEEATKMSYSIQKNYDALKAIIQEIQQDIRENKVSPQKSKEKIMDFERTSWTEMKKPCSLFMKVERLESLITIFRSLNACLKNFKSILRLYDKKYNTPEKRRENYLRLLNYIQKSRKLEQDSTEKITTTRYEWGLLADQFKKDIVSRKNYQSRIDILLTNVEEIYKEYQKLILHLEKINKSLKDFPQSDSWKKNPPSSQVKRYRTQALNLIEKIKRLFSNNFF